MAHGARPELFKDQKKAAAKKEVESVSINKGSISILKVFLDDKNKVCSQV